MAGSAFDSTYLCVYVNVVGDSCAVKDGLFVRGLVQGLKNIRVSLGGRCSRTPRGFSRTRRGRQRKSGL
jgi:hypothetical protein